MEWLFPFEQLDNSGKMFSLNSYFSLFVYSAIDFPSKELLKYVNFTSFSIPSMVKFSLYSFRQTNFVLGNIKNSTEKVTS